MKINKRMGRNPHAQQNQTLTNNTHNYDNEKIQHD